MHGDSSTTLQRTLRARHDTHALAARRFVTFAGAPSAVAVESERCFLIGLPSFSLCLCELASVDGGGEPAADESEASDDMVVVVVMMVMIDDDTEWKSAPSRSNLTIYGQFVGCDGCVYSKSRLA